MKIINRNVKIENEFLIIKGNRFLQSDFKNDFLHLSNNELLNKYNLSGRGYFKLVKEFNLIKQNKSKFDIVIENLDKEKFKSDYEYYSKKQLCKIYNLSDDMISKIIKFYDLHLTLDQINAKVKRTSIEKFGSTSYATTKECKERVKRTKLEKYGDENYCNSEKAKQTNLQKYGYTNPNKSNEVREKIKNTNKLKYGDDCYFRTEEFKEKAKKVKNDRYNNENYTNREKCKQTCLEKYGTEYPNQSEIVKEKRRITTLNKYGVENVWQSKEVKEKLVNTCMEKYNVKYPCMTAQCRNSGILGNNSSVNLKFIEYLDKLNVPYEREINIDKYSYDFKVNSVLIEINPSATHNSTWGWRGNKDKGLDKNYHQVKSRLAEKCGYRCVCIWDWDDIDKVMKSVLDRPKIYAKNCEIKLVELKEAKEFLINNHIQGYVKSDINIGLFYNNELISIMTFGKPRYNKKYDIELLRYCSIYNVVGGVEKLFAYFLNNYNYNSIISYCDRSKFKGDIYKKLNFNLINEGKPSKHWCHTYTKQHITDNLLRQRGFDQLFHTNYGKGASNEELMLENGFVEIYDCGQDTYVFNKIRQVEASHRYYGHLD